MSTHPITVHPARGFKANSHDAVNNPHLRQSFRGAMDFLMAKRAAQFPDHNELEALRTLGETVRQRCLAKLPQLLETLETRLTANGVQEIGRASCRERV